MPKKFRIPNRHSLTPPPPWPKNFNDPGRDIHRHAPGFIPGVAQFDKPKKLPRSRPRKGTVEGDIAKKKRTV